MRIFAPAPAGLRLICILVAVFSGRSATSALGLDGITPARVERLCFQYQDPALPGYQTYDAALVAELLAYFDQLKAKPSAASFAGVTLTIRLDFTQPLANGETVIWLGIAPGGANGAWYASSPRPDNSYYAKTKAGAKTAKGWEAPLQRCETKPR